VLPFFAPRELRRAWSIPRAVTFGAVVGVIAALFKTFGPLREAGPTSTRIFEIAARLPRLRCSVVEPRPCATSSRSD
jgi:hypothetical protein